MPPFWYRCLWALVEPLYRLRVWLRSRRASDYHLEVQQRFCPVQTSNTVDVWVHAVSVGETNAASLLVEQLLHDGYRVLVTSTTRTGRDRVMELFGQRVEQQFLPIDRSHLMSAMLSVYGPKLMVLVETELWPVMLSEAKRAGVAAVIYNARLSVASKRGYARFGRWMRQLFEQLDMVLAQDVSSGQRFVELGVRDTHLKICGSVKFDIYPDAAQLAYAQRLRSVLNQQKRFPILVAASTHDDEEEQLLAAYHTFLEKHPTALLILVPRHPQRFEVVAAQIRDAKFPLLRRAHESILTSKRLSEAPVYLADSMGEMWLWYAVADMVFVGGSLVPVGGHNVIEPASVGRACVVGPYCHNFATIVDQLCAAEALQQVEDIGGLFACFEQWCQTPQAYLTMAENAQRVVCEQQGAFARQYQFLHILLQ